MIEIYSESLASPWYDGGWGTTTYNNTTHVHSGTYAIQCIAGQWSGLQIQCNSPYSDWSAETTLDFWLYSTIASQNFYLVLRTGIHGDGNLQYNTITANQYNHVQIPLSNFGIANMTDMFSIQIGNDGDAQTSGSTFWVDDFYITGGGGGTPDPYIGNQFFGLLGVGI